MFKIFDSIYNIRFLDDISKQNTFIHNLHPLTKFLTTIVYIFILISFSKNEVSKMIPLIVYPILVFVIGEIPIKPILKIVGFAMIFVLGVAVLNPILENEKFEFCGLFFSRGWITSLSMILKGFLTITASLLLVSTTGIDKIGCALRMIKVPKIFVVQLILTYRYIIILSEELLSMLRAYSLRAPNQKGLNYKVWGTFAGQLLLKTFKRADNIYESMKLRGFEGEYNLGNFSKLKLVDYNYIIIWIAFFVIVRMTNISILIGDLVIFWV